MKSLLVIVIVTASIIDGTLATSQPLLNGVTIVSEPFVKKDAEGRYSGIAVDVMNFIETQNIFTYRLYESPDNAYGRLDSESKWNGMIGEVQSGKAHFALGDLTITKPRSEAVDFTVPFHEIQLSALVNKKYLGDLKNLKDLAEKTNIGAVGVLNHGSTHAFFMKSQQETAKKLLSKIDSDKEKNLVSTHKEGIERVVKGETPFAMIGDSTYHKYLAASHPEVAVLEDQEKIFPRHFGIAVPKGFSYLDKFNDAITKWRKQNPNV